MKINLRIAISLLLVFALASACDDEYFSEVPDVDVSTYFYLDEAEFFNFDTGMSLSFDDAGGYAGIILYCVQKDQSYHAFDLCCPIHYDEKEELVVDGAIATCPTDSVYFILSNTISSAIDNDGNPAYLKSYKTSLSGSTLRVYN